MASPLMPGPPSQPRVAGKAGTGRAPPGAGAKRAGAPPCGAGRAAAAPSNLHSVRGMLGGFADGVPSTFLGSNLSTSPIVPIPRSDGRRQPATAAIPTAAVITAATRDPDTR